MRVTKWVARAAARLEAIARRSALIHALPNTSPPRVKGYLFSVSCGLPVAMARWQRRRVHRAIPGSDYSAEIACKYLRRQTSNKVPLQSKGAPHGPRRMEWHYHRRVPV
jgi:hypothetical protein